MPPSKDIYETLGVQREASQDEIRKAYLKLAHKYHPDKTGGDKEAEQKLKEVNAAYDVLKNPEKRSQYDRFGSADGQSPFGGGPFGGSPFGQGGEAPFEDFFDMLFGQNTRRGPGGAARGRPGNDLEYPLNITLEEAAFGAKKKIRFARRESCGDCNGSGAAAGSRPETCPQCSGTGQIRASQGFFSVSRTCNRCQGMGQVISKPCGRCKGSGQMKGKRELSVDIPAGIETGSRLRVSGEGEGGTGGAPRGDLYIMIEVAPHKLFDRQGTTVICEVPISFTQAALGASIRVPTLQGEADLKVPVGAQTGTQLRLRGLGMPDVRGYRQGDQIVSLVVETPAKLSKRQRELLKELEELADNRTHPMQRAFSDRVQKASN